jgi:hypothetical protein
VGALQTSVQEFEGGIEWRASDPGGDQLARFNAGIQPGGTLWMLEMELPPEHETSEVGASLATWLHALAVQRGYLLGSVESARRDAYHALLEHAGFAIARRKALVERSIEGYRSPCPEAFTSRSLRDVGEEAFAAIVSAASLGDPFDETPAADAIRALHDSMEYAGTAFDANNWWVAELKGEPVGVLLPQEFATNRDADPFSTSGCYPPNVAAASAGRCTPQDSRRSPRAGSSATSARPICATRRCFGSSSGAGAR